MRSAVGTMMTRLLAGGETDLAKQLLHPAFVDDMPAPERRNGRVVEHSSVRDDLGMLMQLGLVPPPRPAGGSSAPG